MYPLSAIYFQLHLFLLDQCQYYPSAYALVIRMISFLQLCQPSANVRRPHSLDHRDDTC